MYINSNHAFNFAKPDNAIQQLAIYKTVINRVNGQANTEDKFIVRFNFTSTSFVAKANKKFFEHSINLLLSSTNETFTYNSRRLLSTCIIKFMIKLIVQT